MNEEQTVKIMDKLSDIDKRIVRIETLIQEWSSNAKDARIILKEHERRISDLENQKSAAFGAKDVVAWLIVTGIALWGALK